MTYLNYKALLQKYIKYVQNVEGTEFLTVYYRDCSNIKFTEAEWNELNVLAQTAAAIQMVGEKK